MKKQILVAILCLATGFAVAQQKIQRDRVQMTFSPEKVSATTAMLYYGLKTDNPRLLKDITFVNAGGAKSVVGFVVVPDSNMSKLAEYGITINGSKNGWIKTATFPLNTFVSFVESGLANYINIGNKATPQMDSARYYTNADAVQRGGGSGVTLPRGYCGKNVVVGIVDIGFDFTHRNFYDSTETIFRIKRLWDQNDSTGTMPQGYSYGSEYTTPQAIQARLYSHNYHSHGSHVAGIAGGGGTTDTSVSKYKGMAPESDLVFVATSGSSTMLYEGVEYIADYAQSVGKPCVINLSWGSTIGSHDGKDWFDMAIDYLVDTVFTNNSTIITISASNNGNDSLHLSKTFTARDNVLRSFAEPFSKDPQFNGIIDIWGEVGQTFSFRISVYDTSNGVRVDSTQWIPVTGYSSYSDYCNNLYYYYDFTDVAYNNNKPNLVMYLDNTAETDSNLRVLLEISATQGTVHLWIGNDNGQFSNCGKAWAQSGNTEYTLNSFGQSEFSILVASYNSRYQWYPVNIQRQYHIIGTTPIGSRSAFSSIGPGLGTLHKPDVAAPGCAIISSYNYGDTVFSNDSLLVTNIISNGNHNSYFGIMQGTSMAAPAACGIIALWLEAYPYLTVHQVRDIIRHTSISDSITGPIPSAGSDEYGLGKINALAGMQYLLNKIPAKPIIADSIVYICGNSRTTLRAPSGYARYLWSTGQTTQNITVSSAGTYKVRVFTSDGYQSPWSNNITVQNSTGTAPDVMIRGNDLIDMGETTTLTAIGANTYLWSTGETTASIQVSPIQTTTYWVIGTNNEGCSDSASIVVHVRNAINAPSEPMFNLYPNPASSYITVVGEDIAKITIYNMLGEKKDIITPSDDKNVEISLKGFAKGVYIIAVENNKGLTGRKTFVVR